MNKPFTISVHDPNDKWIFVQGPDLNIRIDYDDVPQRLVRKSLRKMVSILNEHWEDKSWPMIAQEEIRALKNGRKRVSKNQATCKHEDDGGMFFSSCKKCGKVLDDYQPGGM
jgi:hypothetical protein